MHLKGHLVLLQQSKPLDPILVGQEVIICSFRNFGMVRVKVQHVTDTTETLVERLSLQDICCVGSGEIAMADYGWRGEGGRIVAKGPIQFHVPNTCTHF